MEKYLHFIDGQATEPNSGEFFETANPFTGDSWALVARGDTNDVDRAVAAAAAAGRSGPWHEASASERGRLLNKLADLLERDAEKLAAAEVRDNGKLYAEMISQTRYLPQWYRYYGGLADKVEGSVIPMDKPGYFTFTDYEPLGVIGILTPWNSPLLLTAWKLAPALAAGNTVVIKPSEFTSTSVLECMTLFEEAGFPPGVVNVVTGFGTEVGTPLVGHPDVAKIAFTGSDATGRLINAQAGAQMKHVTMELGGKSPNIVFDDANLDEAVDGVVAGIFAASGQTCLAGSRLLVQSSVHDDFVDRLLDRVAAARLGDPMSADTQIGPIATIPQMQKILDYVDVGRQEGATLAFGGNTPAAADIGPGWFVCPTVFTNVTNTMRIAREEIFGPVLSILRFADEDEAVRIANDTVYGLAAGVWTQDMARAFRISRRIQAGTVWVNTYRATSYLAPFGGYKQSGIGRESGKEMIKEYLQMKTVWLNIGAAAANPFVQR